MKQKMDPMKKVKLIYSGELLFFALIFITISILKFVGVIAYNSTRSAIFNWITIFGGSWLIADLIWALFDKKRQKRIALIDKFIHAPAGAYLIAFDLYCLISQTKDPNVFRYGVAAVLAYLGLCYTFEAIYHYYFPIPGLLDVVVEEDDETPNNDEPSKEEKEEEDTNNE